MLAEKQTKNDCGRYIDEQTFWFNGRGTGEDLIKVVRWVHSKCENPIHKIFVYKHSPSRRHARKRLVRHTGFVFVIILPNNGVAFTFSIDFGPIKFRPCATGVVKVAIRDKTFLKEITQVRCWYILKTFFISVFTLTACSN